MTPSLYAALALAAAALAAGLAIRGERRQGPYLALGLLVLAAQASLYRPFTVDDAYIFFRYARNLAAGQGAVYNPGERVEGFTSPAWLGLLALAEATGAPPALAADAYGLLAAGAALALAFGAARSLAGGSALRALPALVFLAGSPLFAAWAMAGMDTPLFALWVALVVALVLAARTARDGGRQAGKWLVLALASGTVVRPEAGLVAVVTLASLGALGLARLRTRAAIGFAAGTALVVLARFIYYGSLLPNTFTAKVQTGGGALAGGLQNLGSIALFLGAGVPLLAVAGAVRLRVPGAYLALLVTSHLAYVAAAGGDVLGLRIHVPLLAPLSLLVAAGWTALFDVLCAHGSRLARGRTAATVQALAAAAYLALGAWEGLNALGRSVDQSGTSYVVLNSRNVDGSLVPAARFVREHAAAGSRVAIDDIGGFGWTAADLRIVDLYGLVDRRVAELRRGRAEPNEAVAAYVLAERPEWLVLRGARSGPFRIAGVDVSERLRAAGYRPVQDFARGSYIVTALRREGE